MFGGKSDEKPAEKDKSSDKKDKPKDEPKKAKDDEKPSAAVFEPNLLLRVIADASVPSFSLITDALAWRSEPTTHYVAFLGFGKKKDADAEDDSSKKKDSDKSEKKKDSDKKKDDKKEEPKKKEDTKKKDSKPEPKPEPKKEEKPKAEAPKPQPKKERMVSVAIPLSDFERVAKRSDAKQIFIATVGSLNSLATRAHPLFRPLIKEYSDLVSDIANHKAKDVDAKLKELRAKRDQVLSQAKAVRDHLDVYEANESTDYSGMFDDYLRLPKAIEQEIPRRMDPISRTLDELEKQSKD